MIKAELVFRWFVLLCTSCNWSSLKSWAGGKHFKYRSHYHFHHVRPPLWCKFGATFSVQQKHDLSQLGTVYVIINYIQ